MSRNAVPVWTQLSKKRGIDPLGMQNSSVIIYQRLLPGISNVTLRIRYYGLYLWLADRYSRDLGDTNLTTWQRRIRRAEALYALISHVKGGERGVGGADWAQRRLAVAEQGRLNFQDDTEPGSDTHYLQNAWGVFGQAYQSQLIEMGLMERHTHHYIATTAVGLGRALAQAFARSAGELGELFLRTITRGWTTLKELEQMAPLAPSCITRGDEQDCYEAILFGGNSAPANRDEMRGNTLKLILRWADGVGSSPRSDELRWSMYSGYLPAGAPWLLPSGLEDHRLRWAVYQANDIAHIAMETLLMGLLTHLEEYPSGCSQGELIERAVSTTSAQLPEAKDWSTFVALQELSPDASDPHHPGSEWNLTRHSWMSASKHDMSTGQQCAAAVRVLAVLQRRMTPYKAEIATELSGLNQSGFRSLMTELNFLEENSSLTLSEMIRQMFLDRVLRRHLWVAMRKLRFHGDYTFLFETDDGLIRKRGDDGPVWTGPRLVNAITFLEDLGLLGENASATRVGRLLGGQ
ncbi:hypothetical protein XSP_003833 [Xanthomonas euroxanthea]|uniref:Uncharacterized protein n=2 Tax=Xanthomonas euroxanthea TaxID=2259622 RepID=A0A8E4E882_9XANT|nr:hypothetical protein XSP_003833 [Xanthomonas euroxanthea]SYZ54830.1 hypothetical protein CPBF367_23150 [Xanthomonas arboricola pv. juglandis]